jgi:curved DNA-binding protein CbpA
MNAQYFETCNTLEEAKTLYKSLARANHPDTGGDLRTMQEINAQYAEYCASIRRTNFATQRA